MAFFGVNFILQKFCPCKKNDKYQVCGQVGQFERRKLVNIPYVFVIINIYAFWSFKLYTQKNMNFRRFATTFIVFLVARGIRDTTNGFRLNILLKSDNVFRLRFYVVFFVDVMNQFQVKIWFFTSAKCTSYNWSLKPVACWRCSIFFISTAGALVVITVKEVSTTLRSTPFIQLFAQSLIVSFQ